MNTWFRSQRLPEVIELSEAQGAIAWEEARRGEHLRLPFLRRRIERRANAALHLFLVVTAGIVGALALNVVISVAKACSA